MLPIKVKVRTDCGAHKPHHTTLMAGMAKLAAASVLALAGANTVQALDWHESPQIGARFRDADMTGTFVVADPITQQLRGYNESRARTRYIPASTFKIAHTLIGLDSGAVQSVDEILPYGGQPQAFKAWEKDMSLRQAITLSNAAIYQTLARRIGLERLRAGVTALDCGNREIGTVIDQFWLQGPLKISAVEQTAFLARLARRQLPMSTAIQHSMHDIIRLEHGDGWTLYGKTGWENAPGAGIGWWVGWLEKSSHVYAFALNLDIRRPEDAAQRIELGKASLRALGLL